MVKVLCIIFNTFTDIAQIINNLHRDLFRINMILYETQISTSRRFDRAIF